MPLKVLKNCENNNMPVIKELVLEKLSSILIDESKDSSNIVAAGLVSEIVIANDRVFFAISANKEEKDKFEIIRKKAEEVVKTIPGVNVVRVSLTSHDKSPPDLSRNDNTKKQVINNPLKVLNI